MRIWIVFLTFNFLLFTFISPVFAQEDNIGTARIDASSPLYFLKSVREILELKFAKTTQDKANIQLEFTIRRIREVKSLARTSREDLIEPTLEKYVWHLQELKGITLFLKDEDMVNKVNGSIITQMNTLQEVFKVVNDPKAKRSIRLTIFRISENFTAPRSAACNFLSKEASSSAISDVERVVLLNRVEKCR